MKEINAIFQEATGIYGKDIDLEHMTCLSGKVGKALLLNHAAECLLDYKRTDKFFKGFVESIKDQQAKYPKRGNSCFLCRIWFFCSFYNNGSKFI